MRFLISSAKSNIPSDLFKVANSIQVLGLGSVAIGFAFRDVLPNFLAGVFILLAQPFRIFRIGEEISVDGKIICWRDLRELPSSNRQRVPDQPGDQAQLAQIGKRLILTG